MLRFIYVILANIFRAPYMIPMMRRMIAHPEWYSEEKKYSYAQKMIRYMMKSGNITTEVSGEENLPKEGGYVMFPNHQGKYDALGIIISHKTPCTFVMDRAKSYGFLVREIVDLLGAKRLVLNNVKQGLRIINEMATEVSEGRKYIIFSEGGYLNNHNHVQEFKPGSFKCAVKAKAPIVPVALIDSYKVFNSLSIRPVKTKVVFLQPLYYDEYAQMKTPEIASIVRERIIACIQEQQKGGER